MCGCIHNSRCRPEKTARGSIGQEQNLLAIQMSFRYCFFSRLVRHAIRQVEQFRILCMNSRDSLPRRPGPSLGQRGSVEFHPFFLRSGLPFFLFILPFLFFPQASHAAVPQADHQTESWFVFEPYPATILVVSLAFVLLLLWQFSRARLRRPNNDQRQSSLQ